MLPWHSCSRVEHRGCHTYPDVRPPVQALALLPGVAQAAMLGASPESPAWLERQPGRSDDADRSCIKCAALYCCLVLPELASGIPLLYRRVCQLLDFRCDVSYRICGAHLMGASCSISSLSAQRLHMSAWQ